MEHQSHQGEGLHQHLVFAQLVGGDDDALGQGDASQHGHGYLAGDDDDHEPRGHVRISGTIDGHQHDEGGYHQQLVRQGIQQLAEVGYALVPARQIAVEHVGHGCDDEDQRGQRAGHRVREREQVGQEGHQEDTEEAQQVRQCPHDVGSLTGTGGFETRPYGRFGSVHMTLAHLRGTGGFETRPHGRFGSVHMTSAGPS